MTQAAEIMVKKVYEQALAHKDLDYRLNASLNNVFVLNIGEANISFPSITKVV